MSVLTLAQAKAHLNITSTDFDSELTAFADAAEAAVAQEVGPLSSTSVTARVPGYAWNLYLPTYPAISLTSVTVASSATTLTLADLYLDTDSGQVSYTSGNFFSSSAYDVVYTAGRASVPADLLQAVKDRLKLDWATQRGSGGRPGAPSSTGPELKSWPEILASISRHRLQILGA